MESLFKKTVSPHVCNCIKKDVITGVSLWINFVNTIFSIHFTQASVRACSTKLVLLKILENLQETPAPEFFFLEKVAHYQTCNFVKKRLQHKCFSVDFAQLLKALCRTSPVSSSNFNSTFLALRPRKVYIYVFPALPFLDISKPLHTP